MFGSGQKAKILLGDSDPRLQSNRLCSQGFDGVWGTEFHRNLHLFGCHDVNAQGYATRRKAHEVVSHRSSPPESPNPSAGRNLGIQEQVLFLSP